MPRQRPALRNVGAVACRRRFGALPAVVAALVVALTGCGGLDVSPPSPAGAHARACTSLVKALPHRVADQPRRSLDAGDRYVAAWGDPPIVLRCGVERPEELTRTSYCQVANGVGWFIPEEQMNATSGEVTMTTVGRAEYVEVRIPDDYWPPATAMADLAPAIKQTIREVRPCL